ncbi:MAG TPA: hypothetical protein VLA34_07235, partial [Candidatus Krumholzibacterium sp.]|nr:hypothetical protein [Candidatus Krumholzibacterium sp.]
MARTTITKKARKILQFARQGNTDAVRLFPEHDLPKCVELAREAHRLAEKDGDPDLVQLFEAYVELYENRLKKAHEHEAANPIEYYERILAITAAGGGDFETVSHSLAKKEGWPNPLFRALQQIREIMEEQPDLDLEMAAKLFRRHEQESRQRDAARAAIQPFIQHSKQIMGLKRLPYAAKLYLQMICYGDSLRASDLHITDPAMRTSSEHDQRWINEFVRPAKVFQIDAEQLEEMCDENFRWMARQVDVSLKNLTEEDYFKVMDKGLELTEQGLEV